MAAKREIIIILLTIKYNILRAHTEFKSFVLNLILSIMNNAIFIIQWIVLFSIHGNFGNYEFEDIMYIWAIACSTGAVSGIIFGGSRTLPELILYGKLDSFIVQPRNLYFNIATSQTDISAFGDLVYSIILCIIFSKGFSGILMFVLFTITGTLIWSSFYMLVGSLTFWIVNGKLIASLLNNVLVAVSTYPDGIFNKFIKTLLYSVFPVGFIVYIPAETLKSPQLYKFFMVLVVTIVYFLISLVVFYKGEKRYCSSNMMTTRI